ncbi:MAG: dual specificity protein phosphatase family protein [Candidatus Binatia bacterium]
MGNIFSVSGTPHWRVRLAQAKTTALLSVLFIVVYGGANWITSQRSDVGLWFFEWERNIPFVPLMILPYMSIDIFFVAAPFLCWDEQERRIFAKRVTIAIFVAGVFFLLVPLRFAFPRPVVSGGLGGIYQFLHGFDQPFNLFPSLHITLQTILADKYSRHTKGFLRRVVQIWFSLIGLSTLLTYQHHIIDVIGGFILAAFCFYFVYEPSSMTPASKNLRVGLYYGMGCAVVLGLSLYLGPWGSLLLWPAFSLGVVAAAYLGVGPSLYRKKEGRLPLSTQFLLAPFLLGQRLSLLYYRRQGRPWNEVAPGILIGQRLSRPEAQRAVSQGITAVLDLTSEFSETSPFLSTNYLNLPVLDLTAPTQTQLEKAAAFIQEQSTRGKVYVHCKIGYSRSAAAVGAYLLKNGLANTAEEAVKFIRGVRPLLIVRPEALGALHRFRRNFSQSTLTGG